MKLLIISIYYNRAEQVEASVRSLLEAAPAGSKILLVDDGSPDNTLNELKQFDYDKRVVVLTGANQGFTKTLVQTIKTNADPDAFKYLSIYGSGDLCSKDKFEKQISYLEENEDIAALGTGHTVRSYKTGSMVLEENDFYEATKETLTKRVPFTQGTVVYRLSDYYKTDGYSTVFKYSQDKDFYFRLIEHGRIVRYPESLYTQYMFEDGASSNPTKKREQIKYQELIKLNYTDSQQYRLSVQEIKKSDIHTVFPDSLFTDQFKSAQKRLILQGEFGMASAWSDIIYSVNHQKKQQNLKKILINLEKINILKSFTSKLFYFTRKILR